MLRDRVIAATSQLTLADQLRRAAAIALGAASVSDEHALGISLVFPDWEVGTAYATGDIVRHGGGLWRALQASTGEEQYPPEAFIAGWKRVGEPDADGTMPWSQPLGAADAYAEGDVVTHDGKTWVSDIDGNVWEPGAYGWSEVGDGD